MIAAVIPAAGKSTRMGRPKLALTLGGRTVLERVIDALKAAAVDPVLVVLAPHVADLADIARQAGAVVLVLANETPDMRATVEQGLSLLEGQYRPTSTDQWLLIPADHPTLDPAIIRELVKARASHPEYSIVVPTYQGKRGHPTLIDWKHVAGLRELPPDRGINSYLRACQAETLELAVASGDVLLDLDTPEDYRRLQHEPPIGGGGS